jgi:hypothetical protein
MINFSSSCSSDYQFPSGEILLHKYSIGCSCSSCRDGPTHICTSAVQCTRCCSASLHDITGLHTCVPSCTFSSFCGRASGLLYLCTCCLLLLLLRLLLLIFIP